jgi:hypothetical protein
MLVPLIFLCLLSVIAGYTCKEMFVGIGTPFFQSATFVFLKSSNLEAEFLSPAVKNLPLFLTLLGVFFSYFFIYCNKTWKAGFLAGILHLKLSAGIFTLYKLLSKKWHFDQIINEFVTHRVMTFGHKISFQTLDKGFIEKYGALGSSASFCALSENVAKMHAGFLFHYLPTLFLSLLALTLLITPTAYCFSFIKCFFLFLNYFLGVFRSQA